MWHLCGMRTRATFVLRANAASRRRRRRATEPRRRRGDGRDRCDDGRPGARARGEARERVARSWWKLRRPTRTMPRTERFHTMCASSRAANAYAKTKPNGEGGSSAHGRGLFRSSIDVTAQLIEELTGHDRRSVL